MEFKTLLTKPKIMALSGLITMGCKLVVAGILAIVMSFCMNKNVFFAGAFILYPIVALIFDIALYLNKDKIWTTLPDNVPSEWNSAPQQLLAYAQNLPKIRLMRFLICWISIPFIDLDKGWMFVVSIMTAVAMGFVVCSLFDMVWLNIFKLTKPALIRNTVEQQKNLARWNKQLDDDFNSRIREQLARNCNATAVGSPAWFAQQHFHSR